MISRQKLLRIVYASRAANGDAAALAPDIAAFAQAFNAGAGITGLLVAANSWFIQLLDGPTPEVRALYERIGRDRRHADVTTLLERPVSRPAFESWSMGLVLRTEEPADTEARIAALRTRLAADPAVRSADFFRLIVAPRVSSAAAAPSRMQNVWQVAIGAPGGLWGSALLQHVASKEIARVGRTTLRSPLAGQHAALIEYVDGTATNGEPLRLMSLSAAGLGQGAISPLLERMTLLVLMPSASEVAGLPDYAYRLFSQAAVRNAAPMVLLVSPLGRRELAKTAEAVSSRIEAEVHVAQAKLSDAQAVWRCIQEALAAVQSRVEALPLGYASPVTDMTPLDSFEPALPVERWLRGLLEIERCECAAILSTDAAGLLAGATSDGQASDAFAAELDWLRAKQRLLEQLGQADEAELFTVSTTTSLQVFHRVPDRPHLVLAVSVARQTTTVAAVWSQLRPIVQQVAFEAQSG